MIEFGTSSHFETCASSHLLTRARIYSGRNSLRYELIHPCNNERRFSVKADLHLWQPQDKIVVVDIDGTVTVEISLCPLSLSLSLYLSLHTYIHTYIHTYGWMDGWNHLILRLMWRHIRQQCCAYRRSTKRPQNFGRNIPQHRRLTF